MPPTVLSLATTLRTHIHSTTLVNNKPHKSAPCPEDLSSVPQCPTHRKAKLFSKVAVAFVCSDQQCMGVFTFPHPCQYLVFSI